MVDGLLRRSVRKSAQLAHIANVLSFEPRICRWFCDSMMAEGVGPQ